MSRFIKLENVIEISIDHYGEKHISEQEREHVKTIKAAQVRHVNVRMIDEVVPTKVIVKDDNDEDLELDAVYLIQYHDGAISDRGSGHARDRDSFFIVPGTAEEWVTRIESVIQEDIALHHPEPAGQRGHGSRRMAIRRDLFGLDMTAHPETGEKLLCVSDHESSSKLELIDKTKWRGLGELA